MEQGYEKDELDAAYRTGYRHGVDAAIARAEAAEKRVAELEAQLAATAWRPVTEPPTDSGRYHVLYRNAVGNLIDDLQFWHNGAEFPAACWHGSMAQNGRYAEYWRPLPPPPTD